MVRAVGFSRVHVFSYSRREGTEAARWGEAVPPAVVAARRERLLELERELAGAYYRSLLGRRLDVLVEGADPRRLGLVRGTSERYAPVSFRGHAPALLRRRVPVRAVAVDGDTVLGEPEPEEGWPSPPRDGRLSLPLVAAG